MVLGTMDVYMLTTVTSIRMNNNYYSKLVLYTEFNGLFQLVPFVFFKFHARLQYENLAHYLF